MKKRAKPKLLLVDGCPDTFESMGHTLRLEGYDVIPASNGHDALGALRETWFDLVLLDLDLPAFNGWDTLDQIVEIRIRTGFSVPVIIFAGRADEQRLAAQKGVAAVLQKPVDLASLMAVMKQLAAAQDQNVFNLTMKYALLLDSREAGASAKVMTNQKQRA
jgi:two-component system, OmpR family, response regulator